MKIDVDDPLYDELRGIEARIKAGEGKSIVDRWQFGRALVQRRDGRKQLPTGVLAEITEQFGLEGSEITRRMKLADTFATRDEVVDACTRCGSSWRRIIREELSKRETAAKPKPAWDERIRVRLDKLVNEAGESDERRAALVALLQRALCTLVDAQEVAA